MNPLDKFAESITQDDIGKYDIETVSPSDIQYLPSRGVRIGKGDKLEPTHWATKQLCSKLQIPFKFWDKLPGDLGADIVNYLLGEHDKPFLLRCRPGMVRAFLSEEYTVYNNKDVVNVLQTAFEGSTIELPYPHMDDQSLWARIVIPSMERGGHKAGIIVGNSEVGARSLSAAAFIFTMICSNGLVAGRKSNEFKLPHHYLRPSEMGTRLVEHIGKLLEYAPSVIERMMQAQEEKVPNLTILIDKLTKEYEGPKKFADEWKINSLAAGAPTMASLINGLTATARGYAGDTRTEWERRAGDLLFDLDPVPTQLVPNPMFVAA